MERITNFVDSHLELIADVSVNQQNSFEISEGCHQTRELYTARIALEREYAGKLQVMARKFSEKKAKVETSFVLGNEPNKTWDSAVLRQR